MSDSGLANYTGLTSSGIAHVQIAQYGNDTGLHAEFYSEAVLQPFESEQKGRPVYKDTDFIFITRPGAKSDLKRVVRLVTDGTIPTDPQRFPRQWEAYKAGKEQAQSGLPLEQWPPLTKATVLELKAAKIHTVEQLAGLPDSTLQNIGMMDARRFRDMALAYVNKAGDGAALSSALSEVEKLKADIAAMKSQFAALAGEQTEAKKRGPGRPRKEEANADQV